MESGEGCSRIQDAAGLCGCRGITDIGTSHSNLYALNFGTRLLPGKTVRLRNDPGREGSKLDDDSAVDGFRCGYVLLRIAPGTSAGTVPSGGFGVLRREDHE